MKVEKLCRVCLSECDELTPLWEKLPGESKTLEEAINFVVNIKVNLQEGLPDKICSICESLLDLADTFKQRCLETESILEQQTREKQSNESQPKCDKNHQGNTEIYSEDTSCLPTVIPHTKIPESLTEMSRNAENIYDLPEHKIKMEIEEHHVDAGATIRDQENLDTVKDLEAGTKSNESCVVKEEVSEKTVRQEMWSCAHCSLTFQTKISYKVHMFNTHKHKPKVCMKFKCELCKETFTCEDSFEVHLRTHSHEKNEINGPPASNNSADSQRVCFHCEERHQDYTPSTPAPQTEKFECFDCKKSFNSFDGIKAHLRTHTKPKIKTICAKKFICKTCNQRFGSEMELLKHIQASHLSGNESGTEFPSKGSLEPLCKTCDQRFSSETELMKHIQASHLSDNESGTKIPSKESLEPHQIEHTEDAPSLKKPKLDDMQPTTAEVRSATEDPAAADTSTATITETESNFRKVKNTRSVKKKNHGKNSKQKQKRVKKISKDIMKESTTDTATTLKLSGTKTVDKITCATEKQSQCSNNTVIGTTGDIPTCNICGYTTATVKSLNTHLKAHAATKRYSCDSCLYLTTHTTSFQRHVRTHTDEKPYACDVCDKKFIQKGYLSTHLRTHTGERPYSCKICEKTFVQKSYLVIHRRTHTDDKPYNCEVCGSKFNRKDSLTAHATTHTGDQPYSCNECKMKFIYRSHLVRHQKIHTGEKPYSCNKCEDKFAQKSHLDKHLRTHTVVKPYCCDVCKVKYSEKYHLARHLSKAHMHRC